MYQLIPVAGHKDNDCFLLVSDASAVLVDASYEFCGEATAANIRRALGDRPLEYVLITHSHFDHVGGIPAVKDAYPAARVVASAYAKKVVSLENARTLMRSMNAGVAAGAGKGALADRYDEVGIDLVLEDGEELILPDMTIRAVATPGHTRCCMSYYFVEERLLVCSETLGVAPDYPEVRPGLIVGYRATLDSIERSRLLRPRDVFISHKGLIPDGEADAFFAAARDAVEEAARLILGMNERGCPENEMVAAFVAKFFHASAEDPRERATTVNTQAMIPRLLRELGKAPQQSA